VTHIRLHGPFLLCCVGAFLLLLMLNGTVAFETSHIKTRINYGIVFRRVQSFQLVTDHWLHTFAILLPNIDDVSQPQRHVPYCTRTSRRVPAVNRVCTDLVPMLNTLNELRNKSTNHLRRVLDYVDQILPYWQPSKKRSLGSWLGSGISWTFGLAKQTDVDKIKHTVQHIWPRV